MPYNMPLTSLLVRLLALYEALTTFIQIIKEIVFGFLDNKS